MQLGNRRAGAGQHILELPEYLQYNREGRFTNETSNIVLTPEFAGIGRMGDYYGRN